MVSSMVKSVFWMRSGFGKCTTSVYQRLASSPVWYYPNHCACLGVPNLTETKRDIVRSTRKYLFPVPARTMTSNKYVHAYNDTNNVQPSLKTNSKLLSTRTRYNGFLKRVWSSLVEDHEFEDLVRKLANSMTLILCRGLREL